MSENRIVSILAEAIEEAMKYETPDTLGNCLRGHKTALKAEDIESLISLAYNEIADQYYEDPPNEEAQAFLDKIEYIKQNYSKYY